MAAVERTGTSNRMKDQYEKHEKFVRGSSFYFPLFIFFLGYIGKCKKKDAKKMYKTVDWNDMRKEKR